MNDVKNMKNYRKNELPVVNVELNSNYSFYSETRVEYADDAVRLVGEHMYGLAKEHICVICCDNSYLPLCVGVISIGDEKQVFSRIKDFMQIGILSNATHLIAMHNHPSRFEKNNRMNIKPSANDIEFADLLMKACELMGFTLHDSIIVGDFYDGKKHMPVYYSIREDKIKLLQKKNISDVTKTHSLQKVTSNQNRLDWENKAGRLSSYWGNNVNLSNEKNNIDNNIYICFSPQELETLLASENTPEALKEKVEREMLFCNRITNTKFKENISYVGMIKYLAQICESQEEFDNVLQFAETVQIGLVIDKMILANMSVKEMLKDLPKYKEDDNLVMEELTQKAHIYKHY